MNYYFITGVSRGIGKALAELLLKKQDTYVIGMGRTSAIKHERYEFVKIDLSNLDLVKNYQFIQIIDAESVTLLNNAGMLGDVNIVGQVKNQPIIDTFNLNAISPALLMNNFTKAYQNFSGKKMVMNISSGAGRHTVNSWSSYCATKAALDMFTSVANEEQKALKTENPVKFLAVAPGIVDTKMQEEIRAVDEAKFSDLKRFIKYKKENQLASPEEVAEKLILIMEHQDSYENPLLDIRELKF